MTILQDICLLITDGKHGDCTNEKGSGYYFISCKDVKNGWIDYSGARQITEDDYLDTHRRTQLEPSDILITNSGTIGRMALVSKTSETGRTTFQKSVAIIKPDPVRAVPRWLYYCLMAKKEDLIAWAGGTAQKNLLLRDLRAFEVQVPSPLTQRKIAAILSAYDDLIENNLRRIRILEGMAQLIYREWFVNFRFPGHENMKMVDSELGVIPEGWDVSKLSEIAKINNSSVTNGNVPEHINYVNISSVSTGRIDKIESMAFEDAPSRARRIVKHGDVIWSTVRPNRKSYCLILNPLQNMIVSTGFAVITAKNVPYTYLYHALTTDEFVAYLTNNTTGAAYPAVNTKDFENVDVLIPPIKLLESFHSIIVDFYDQKQNLLRKNINLRQTRDLLLPRLISGELDVSELDINTGEEVS